MKTILSRCGYRCDLCLAFRPNIEAHPENRQILSDGWQSYFGFRIHPEEIVCDGCLSAQEYTLDQDCPVRPCVLNQGIENCADCENYICEKLSNRLVNFETMQAKFEEPISESDRRNFIFPYENTQRLESLRNKK